MTLAGDGDVVLVVEPDARVRRALVDLVRSAEGLTVGCAYATAGEAEGAAGRGRARVALVGVRPGSERGFADVRRLARSLPVLAVGPVGSLAGRALAVGAAAYYDEDGDTDALVAMIRDVIAGE